MYATAQVNWSLPIAKIYRLKLIVNNRETRDFVTFTFTCTLPLSRRLCSRHDRFLLL